MVNLRILFEVVINRTTENSTITAFYLGQHVSGGMLKMCLEGTSAQWHEFIMIMVSITSNLRGQVGMQIRDPKRGQVW